MPVLPDLRLHAEPDRPDLHSSNSFRLLAAGLSFNGSTKDLAVLRLRAQLKETRAGSSRADAGLSRAPEARRRRTALASDAEPRHFAGGSKTLSMTWMVPLNALM